MLDVLADLSTDLTEVEACMHKALETQEPRVAQLIAGLGGFNGKMLRPSLVLIVARCLGGADHRHHALGAALEMIHTATLIHDDMIDAGEVRRGTPTPHIRYGNSTAVLLGDFFYTRAFDLVAGLGDLDVVQQITATTNVICEGELDQMCAQRDPELSVDEYYRIIHAKTAILCETACRLGAIGMDVTSQNAVAEYGRRCGLAFQIVDDCLDLIGDPDKVGKTLTTDIERGRLTLPFLKMLDRAPDGERAEWANRYVSVADEAGMEAVRREVVDGGGVQAALDEARAHVEAARQELAALPEGPGRDQLDQLALFIVDRDF
jgi:octaprenyl-diphosphate synthase